MSKGRKSSYPERPIEGKRPPRPGVARHKQSRSHGGGKRRVWLSQGEVRKGPVEAKSIDLKGCRYGHSHPDLNAFILQHSD